MLITILVVLIILALVLYGIRLVPIDQPISLIIQLLAIVIAIYVIARVAGLA